MAITKTAINLFGTPGSPVSVAAGSTKGSPGATSSVIDVTGYHGGELTYRIANGASAPSVGLTLEWQASPNGTTGWTKYYQVAGNTTASGFEDGPSITLTRGPMYLRAIAYGNTTNAVTVEAGLQAVTGL